MKQGNMDGENWWKVKPKYSTKVLIGNWVEDRARVRAGKYVREWSESEPALWRQHPPAAVTEARLVSEG